MSDIEEITTKLINFRNERDWEQFHNSKDLALAISIEAGELLELFLWKNPAEADKDKIKRELADIFAFAFFLAKAFYLLVMIGIPKAPGSIVYITSVNRGQTSYKKFLQVNTVIFYGCDQSIPVLTGGTYKLYTGT